MLNIQFRTHENGGVCCSSRDAAGNHIAPEHPCEKCKAHFAGITAREESTAIEERHMEHHAPNPYEHGLAALMTAEQKTAAELKSAAFGAIDAEANAIASETAAMLRALRADDDLDAYRPPDGYAEALRQGSSR